jgi:hypothetical protein
MRTLVSLAAMALLAAPALAQPRTGFGGPLSLLTNKSVQEELKITDEQKKKVDEASKKLTELRTEKMKEAGITRENMREKRDEMAKITKALNAEGDKSLSSVLDEKQTKRFKQIRLQQSGLRAFSTEEVETALKLSDDQKKKIKETVDGLTKEMEDARKEAGMDFAKLREIFTKQREKEKEALGKVAATLSSAQKKTWKDMTGETFEVKFDRPRPGGGGGRPGGGYGGGR